MRSFDDSSMQPLARQELQEVKEANAQTKAELEAYASELPEDRRESYRKHVTQIRQKSKRT